MSQDGIEFVLSNFAFAPLFISRFIANDQGFARFLRELYHFLTRNPQILKVQNNHLEVKAFAFEVYKSLKKSQCSSFHTRSFEHLGTFIETLNQIQPGQKPGEYPDLPPDLQF